MLHLGLLGCPRADLSLRSAGGDGGVGVGVGSRVEVERDHGRYGYWPEVPQYLTLLSTDILFATAGP